MASTTALKSFEFSAEELAQFGFPEAFVEDYLNLANNTKILSTRFQMFKDGTQSTTGSFATLTGWTQDKNEFGFVLDSAAGSISIPESGEYEATVWVIGDATEQISIKLQLFDLGSSTWNDILGAEDSNTISSQFNNIIFTASTGEFIRIQIEDIGVSTDILANKARLSLGRKA